MSNKPYLVRGIFEWCIESNMTPYLTARILPGVRPPKSHVNEKEIILNISPEATTKLIIDNKYISFFARFNGINEEIYIPMSYVSGIYAHENGEGLFFEISQEKQDPVEKKSATKQINKRNKPLHLTLVK